VKSIINRYLLWLSVGVVVLYALFIVRGALDGASYPSTGSEEMRDGWSYVLFLVYGGAGSAESSSLRYSDVLQDGWFSTDFNDSNWSESDSKLRIGAVSDSSCGGSLVSSCGDAKNRSECDSSYTYVQGDGVHVQCGWNIDGGYCQLLGKCEPGAKYGSQSGNSDIVYVRHWLTLPSPSKDYKIVINADDCIHNLYVNGGLVFSEPNCGACTHCGGKEFQIGEYMRRGGNLLAAEIVNTQGAVSYEPKLETGIRHPFMLAVIGLALALVFMSVPWNDIPMELKLFVLFFVVYSALSQTGYMDVNAGTRLALTKSIVDYRTFIIDHYQEYTGNVDYSQYDGHFYTDKAPLTSFLAIPAYIIARLLSIETVETHLFMATLTVSFFSSLTCVLVYLFSGHLTLDRRARLLVTVTYGFGTGAFPYSTVFYGYQIAAFFLVLSAYMLYSVKKGKLSDWFLIASGISLGASSLAEYTSLLLFPLFLLYVFSFRGRRVLLFLIPLAMTFSILLLYNLVCFGSPLTFSYSLCPQFENWTGVYGISIPKLSVIVELLFKSKRGLFVYSPVLVLSLLGFVRLSRRKNLGEALLFMLVFLVIFLFNSGYFYWEGGWGYGPRFIIPSLPFLSLLLAPVFDSRWLKYLAVALMLASISVMSIAALNEVVTGAEYPISHNWETYFVNRTGRFLHRSYYFNLMGKVGINPWYAAVIPAFAVLFIFRSEVKTLVNRVGTTIEDALAKLKRRLKPPKAVGKILPLLVILAGAYLRFNDIGYVEFKADEAGVSYATVDLILHGGLLDAVGVRTSVGPRMSPFMNFLLLIPFFISKHPAFASLYVACFNVAALVVCYLLVKKFFGRRAGLVASLFFALNPWAVLFSRKIWTQDFLPLFTLLFFYSVLKWTVDKKSKYLVPSFLFMACMWQLHLTSMVLVLVLPIVWLAFRPPVEIKHLLAGIAVFFIMFSQYIYYESNHGFDDFRVMAEYIGRPSVFRPVGILLPLELMTSRGFDYSLGGEYGKFENGLLYPDVLDLLPLVGFAVGIAYIGLNARRSPAYIAVILWFIIPYLSAMFNKSVVYMHYYIVMLPVPFIVIGVFVDKLLSSCSKSRVKWGWLAVLLILSLAAYQAYFTLKFQAFVKAEEDGVYGDYGMPLGHEINYLRRLVEENDSEGIKDRWKNLDDRYLLEYVININNTE
jgi:hypothetical protein